MKGESSILTALTKNGQQVVLSNKWTRKALHKLRSTTTFLCPQCKEEVILKIGEVVIPHFSHKAKTDCKNYFSEGESIQHLIGKQQLEQLFNNAGLQVEIEPFLPAIRQRPDLLITSNQEQIPFEFQCSPIPIRLVEERTAGYIQASYNPYWLLHTPKNIEHLPQGVQTITFTKFYQHFLSTSNPFLITFHPILNRFHYVSHVVHIAGNRFVGIHSHLPFQQQTVPFLRQKLPTKEHLIQYRSIYIRQRQQFLKNRIFSSQKGVQDPFLKSCYEMRFIPQHLPPTIGLPSLFNEAFREHDCEWQLALHQFAKEQEISFDQLSDAHFMQFIKLFNGEKKQLLQACINYQQLIKSIRDKQEHTVESVVDSVFNTRFLAINSRN